MLVRAVAQAPPESPADLVRQTVKNEIASNNGGAKFMFKDHKEMPHGSQTKLMVETRQATAGLLIAVDGKPLTSQQRQEEEARLEGLVNNPDELKRKQKAEREDTEHTLRIMRALPDAFLFEADGTGSGCLLYTSPSPRDGATSRMPSSA